MSKYPDRKRREDCFFGLHFDFHAKPSETGYVMPIGGNFTKEMVFKIIDTVKPDYIQVDCKGHPGWSSYPTKAGNPYPKITTDILKIWREATKEKGVALFVHYSGVCDDFQCMENPEWAARSYKDEGYANWLPKGITSTFSPYVEKIVIPQLLELAGEYEVDGAWLDGECWGTQVDYSDKAIKAFKEKTGVDISDNPPKEPGDENWQEYSDFCRDQFRKYLRKYVHTVHYMHPEFQIASNWAFSSKMPEPVTVEVDFLSGDYLWADSVNSARYEGRCLAAQGMPWDLMAWGFRWKNGDRMERCPKHPVQLKQEAAIVLALGGGFQSYYPQKKDGCVHMWQIEQMDKVAEFCREREEYCHKAKPVPQVAILNSTYNRYHTSRFLFQSEGEDGALQGIVQLFCETGQSFEILSEHHLSGRMEEYPLIVIPETKVLEEGFIDELLAYMEKGGSLLIIGTDSYDVFKPRFDMFGVKETGEYLISEDGRDWAYIHGGFIMNSFAGISHGFISKQEDIDDGEKHSAAEIMRYGEGKAAIILADIGETYLKRKSHVHRKFMKSMVSKLYEPMVTVKGSMYIDMTLMEKDGRMMINLVNTAGSHDDQDVYSIDEIPPIGPVTLSIKYDSKPKKVRIEPSGTKLDTVWDGRRKVLTVRIPKIDIHEILFID
jgi:hypothetical protein